MHQRDRQLIVAVLVLAALALLVVWPQKPDNYMPSFIPWPRSQGIHLSLFGVSFDRQGQSLGLDLQGGTHLVLQADLSKVPPEQWGDSMSGAVQVIERRVNAYGVSEPLVQEMNNNRIAVDLPGVRDVNEAIRLIGQTAQLEFLELQAITVTAPTTDSLTAPTPGATAVPGATATAGGTAVAAAPTVSAPTATPAAGTTVTPGATAAAGATPAPGVTPVPTEPAPQTVEAWVPATGVINGQTLPLTGQYFKQAAVGFDQTTGQPEIDFQFNDEGAALFAQISTRNVGKPVAISLDNNIITAPTIEEPITGGSGRITGSFTLAEARNTVIQLNAGALPVPVTLVEQRDVDATLGSDSVHKSVLAGQVGLVVVLTFMLLYYRLPGLLADAALIIYTLFVLAIFRLVPVTLTLSGIAGFILSIGMAVDANILIFERMKEELRAGRVLGLAIDAGFGRAWPSIRDSNFSTLITCAILYWFGSNFGASLIQGFALTLAIGVLVSMFTAITVSRTFLRLVATTSAAQHLGWWGVSEAPPTLPAGVAGGQRNA